MSRKDSIAFIGVGNMANAMIRGLISNGMVADRLWASDTLAEQLQPLADLGANTTRNNQEAAGKADCVVLGVKPDLVPQVVRELAPVLSEGSLLVSIAAGVTTATIARSLGSPGCIVRFMPNIAAQALTAATGMYATDRVSTRQKADCEQIARAFGNAVWLADEALMDAVTAVSGSGPAYFFFLMELMIKEAQNLGLSRNTATELVLQTALGSARLALQSDADVAELRDRVTSPQGTTAAAIGCFLAADFPGMVEKALQAANRRGKELAGGGAAPKEF